MDTKSTPRPHLQLAATGMTLLLLAQAQARIARVRATLAAKR